MTDDEIDALTIADARRIAKRAAEALSMLAALGVMPQGGAAGASVAAPSPQRAAAPPTRTRTPLSEDEVANLAAQKAALLERNREVLPDAIKAAEGIS